MFRRITIALTAASVVSLVVVTCRAASESDDKWVRGSLNGKPTPVWGHREGLQIGLAPLRGPRGLLRVYAPYLDHPAEKVINFIAVEPIPKGSPHRGLSELEFSRLDDRHGKRFWSANDPRDATPKLSTDTARGVVETQNGVEQLVVYVLVEPFDNGAYVYLKLTFWADGPHEVGIATFAREDSTALDYCVVTATMGNYARLRRLQLADRVEEAPQLWPDYQDDGFAPHAKFPLKELIRNAEGHALAVAESNEEDLATAVYSDFTREHWRYDGPQAKQSWISEQPDPGLEVWVNGRYTYWASRSPIPNGIAFENFEMISPFRQGEEFVFRVEPKIAIP